MPLSYKIFTFFNKISNYFYKKYVNKLKKDRIKNGRMGNPQKRMG